MRIAGPSLVTVALASTAAAVHAQPAGGAEAKTSSLSWTRLPGAEACIGTQELARAVEALLGRSVFVSAAQATLSVEGRVSPAEEGRGWRATLTVADDHGQHLGDRELSAADASCRALDDPLTLAIALMIDPDAAARPAPAPVPPPPPSPREVVRDRTVYVPVPGPERPTWRIGARGGVAFALGTQPSIGAGATGAITLQPPIPMAFEGGAALFLPSHAALGAASGDLQRGHVEIGVCPLVPRFGRLAPSLCLGPDVGMLWGDGKNADGSSWEHHALVIDLAARGRLNVRLGGPVTAGAALGVAVPLARDTFEVRDARGGVQELFRMSPVVARADLTLGLEMP